ncbi:hypothetical protein ACJX0J_014585, partial [Zea mays]
SFVHHEIGIYWDISTPISGYLMHVLIHMLTQHQVSKKHWFITQQAQHVMTEQIRNDVFKKREEEDSFPDSSMYNTIILHENFPCFIQLEVVIFFLILHNVEAH